MAFDRFNGKHNIHYVPKLASTAINRGAILRANGSGFYTFAIATSLSTGATSMLGVITRQVSATDADFATANVVPVDIYDLGDTMFYADVTTGTLTTAMIGNNFDINATGDGINVTGTTTNQLKVVGFISATKAIVQVIR